MTTIGKAFRKLSSGKSSRGPKRFKESKLRSMRKDTDTSKVPSVIPVGSHHRFEKKK